MDDYSRQIDRAVERARDRALAEYLEGEREEKTLAARIESIPVDQFDSDLGDIVLPPPSCVERWQRELANYACMPISEVPPIIRDMLAAAEIYTRDNP